MRDPLTGNETSREIAEVLAEIVESGADALLEQRIRTEVNGRANDGWFTLRLENGAEYQVSVVRSAWPEDGTSTQFADVETEEDQPEPGEPDAVAWIRCPNCNSEVELGDVKPDGTCSCCEPDPEPEIDDEPPPDVGSHAGAIVREYEGHEFHDLPDSLDR